MIERTYTCDVAGCPMKVTVPDREGRPDGWWDEKIAVADQGYMVPLARGKGIITADNAVYT